jgi:hypothetical protein
MGIVPLLVWVLFCIITATYLFNTSLWVGVGLYGFYESRSDTNDLVWESDEVQARIVTIGDAPDVVQKTVDSVSTYIDDVHVVSEQQIDIDGATIHIVPDEFDTSDAIRKGRAMEWARQHVSCEREYVLYLDEDTLLPEFDGLPDEDIVQLQERPRRSDSLLAWLADVWRTGTQYEPRGFTILPYPFFLWGGAFAVRAEVEKDVGWEYTTICEDTLFLFRSLRSDYTYGTIDAIGRNQSPPSFREIVSQRRRWASGTITAIRYLGFPDGLLLLARYVAWIVNSAGLAIALTFLLLGLPLTMLVGMMLVLVTAGILIRAVVSSLMYDRSLMTLISLLVLFPVVVVYDGVGVIYGLIRPARDFSVTEKVSDNRKD